MKRLALLLVAALLTFTSGRAADATADEATLVDRGSSIVLANGILSAEIAKANGNVLSVVYRGTSVLASPGYLNLHSGDDDSDFKDHASTYARLRDGQCTVAVDPRSNGGALADIGIRQKSLGADQPFGVEIHYALRRGESGLYAYLVVSHAKDAPPGAITQIRWLLRLKDSLFDEVAIDDHRRWVMPPSDTPTRPLGPKESLLVTAGPFKGDIVDKYHDFVDAGDHYVHGWIGRQQRLGCWIISGSTEDQNGGPTKQYNTAHFPRILMKIFSCTHYGAAPVAVGREAWQKFYGPCLLYFNSGGGADALWADAKARAEAERAAWPYAWVHNPLYPLAADRGAVTGRLVVTDPQAPTASAAGAWVGLAAPAPDWQQQSDNYQYWVRADAEGRFTIPNVRPGTYTLYAFVGGVMDQFRRDDVTVARGAKTELQTQRWTPLRHGRQIWQIGIPDRSAAEFRHGDDFRHWGLWLQYPKDFPHGVHFVIGQSHERTDWNYAQVNVPSGRKWAGTTWTVEFNLAESPAHRRATLRVALASASKANVAIAVNGRSIGRIETGNDSAMIRAGIHGQYSLTDLPFDGRFLRQGHNEVTFTQTAGGNVAKSVMYDCLRLELADAAGAARE
ncbi:MAG TPA: polysaccharide lyase family protein [Opitutaceae bacterium]|nr:polysaccharide lyase family protein [Opitutaceae bacterium]